LLTEEREGLRQIRRARSWLLLLFAVYLPLLLIATRLARPLLTIAALSIVCAIAMVRCAARLAFSHCPRCSKYFHSGSDAPSFGSLLVRSCMHCGLSLDTGQVIYPSME
jgi:hypothetical protein